MPVLTLTNCTKGSKPGVALLRLMVRGWFTNNVVTKNSSASVLPPPGARKVKSLLPSNLPVNVTAGAPVKGLPLKSLPLGTKLISPVGMLACKL